MPEKGSIEPLNVALTEHFRISDGSPSDPLYGVVAILDALGAGSYTKDQADLFLKSRDLVLDATKSVVATSLKQFERRRLKRFAFNDTVIIAYLLDDLTPQAIPDFEIACHLLRTFQMLALGSGILFRGALAVGDLYRISEPENTIMGPAVSDAASWYAAADWIG